MRAKGLHLAASLALAACGARPPQAPADAPEAEVHTAEEGLEEAAEAALRERAAAGGLLHWRLPGAELRCEPWRFVPDPDDPSRGALELAGPPISGAPDDAGDRPGDATSLAAPRVRSALATGLAAPPTTSTHTAATSLAAPLTTRATTTSPAPPLASDAPAEHAAPTSPPATGALRFAYRISDGHLSLTTPRIERPAVPWRGGTEVVGAVLPCVFSGMSLTTDDAGGRTARRLVLAAHERFFLDAGACAAAGPADEAPEPGELRPLGCATALADLETRARYQTPAPPHAADAGPKLFRARTLYMLRPGRRGPTCEAWRNLHGEGGPRHGFLTRQGRDERGRFDRYYAYELSGGALTLQGPTDVWRLREGRRPAELVRARGCLLARAAAAVSPDILLIGQEPWYMSRRACESARRAGAPARPQPCE